MADTLRHVGTTTTSPRVGSPSGDPSIVTPVDETIPLIAKSIQEYSLDDDPVVTVDLSSLTSVHFIQIKAQGGPIRVRFTSTFGVTQAVPVDSFAMIFTRTAPITAIDLQRAPGIVTVVRLTLGRVV